MFLGFPLLSSWIHYCSVCVCVCVCVQFPHTCFLFCCTFDHNEQKPNVSSLLTSGCIAFALSQCERTICGSFFRHLQNPRRNSAPTTSPSSTTTATPKYRQVTRRRGSAIRMPKRRQRTSWSISTPYMINTNSITHTKVKVNSRSD